MSNNLLKGVVKLTQEQFDTLKGTGTLTVGDETIAYSPKDTAYVVEDNLTEQVAENASAITSLQTEVATLESDVSSLQSSVQTNTSNITQLGTNKLDKNQGISNAGKTMVVGDDGNIIPQTLVEGGTTVTVDGQAQTTWDADTKADVSSLSEVATSGSYSDLINKPTIPTDNSELTNGAGYATTSELNSAVSGKLDTNQGASNAGKVMTVAEDGNVAPEEMIKIKKQTFTSYQSFYTFYSANNFERISIELSSTAQDIAAYDEATNLTTGEKIISAVELSVSKLSKNEECSSFPATYTRTGAYLTVLFATLYGDVSFDTDLIYISGTGSAIENAATPYTHLFSVHTTIDTSKISTITVYYI